MTVNPVLSTSLAAVVAVAVMSAQGQNRPFKPVDLPNGPAKAGFDIARFSSAGNGWFETFYVTQTQPLRDTLTAGKVADDTRLLVTETAGGRLALLTEQMAFHHIAQGSAGGKDWLVSF
jgi:hypothetical protein